MAYTRRGTAVAPLNAAYVAQSQTPALVGGAADVTVWSVQAAGAAAPHKVAAGGNTFSAQFDPIMAWGYNVKANGGNATAGEHSGGFKVEGHYFDNTSGKHWIEIYSSCFTAAGAESRSLQINYNRTTGKHEIAALSGQSVELRYDDGSLGGVAALQVTKNAIDVPAVDDTSNVSLTIHAGATHNASLSIASGSTNGAISVEALSTTQGRIASQGTTVARFYKTGSGAAVAIGGLDDNNAALTVQNAAGNNWKAIVARALSTQTASTLEVQESGGTAHFKVTAATSTLRANTVVGNGAAVATNATDGFLHVSNMAGTPTGTPTAYTGSTPLVIDTSGSKLWAYIGGAWKSVALA